MYAITDFDRKLFFTYLNHVPQFTDNINVAYLFSSEFEALRYEVAINDWLDLECDIVPYINDVTDLFEAEKLRVQPIISTHYGMQLVKSLVFSLLLFLAAMGGVSAQTVKTAKANVSAVGVAVAPVKTGQTFTDKSGKTFEVLRGARGGLFYWDTAKKGANVGSKVKRYIKK